MTPMLMNRSGKQTNINFAPQLSEGFSCKKETTIKSADGADTDV